MSKAKELVPNKEWLVTDNQTKIGSISKNKSGYKFLLKGNCFPVGSLEEIVKKLGISTVEPLALRKPEKNTHLVYNYPCNSKPYNSAYNIRKKLPVFTKKTKSKCLYCAGYYVIKIHQQWIKQFCPKLITVNRHDYYGPFSQESDADKQIIQLMKNNETT